jgi:hypothetical protein
MLGFVFFSFFATATVPVDTELNEVLDNFHQAAGDADEEKYLNLLADDAIFLGTDSSERWNKSEFSAFVKPYFSQGKGWLYRPIERHITPTPVNHIFFFDELLENKSYGRCRGSGLIIKTDTGWKILQYNLSIPVPNAIANAVVESIQIYRMADSVK